MNLFRLFHLISVISLRYTFNMNVDKFGHHIHKRMRLADLFEFTDKALLKSVNDDYDLKLSRLKGIKSPIDSNDAVNKDYVDKLSNTFCTTKEVNKMIAQLRSQIVTDVQNAVNSYLKTKIPWFVSQLQDKMSAKTDVIKITNKSQ